MSSGVVPTDAAVEAYNAIKTKPTVRWLEFGIVDKKVIDVLNKQENRDATYADLYASLDNQCRYFIIDFPHKTPEGVTADKLVFLVWIPDNAPPKDKMLYASSKDAFKKKLEGIVEVQGTDKDEVSEEMVIAKVAKK
eukprot:NODE_2481_length_562_cov_126.613793_g2431_i0.p1 GENE.NODE_2481_length_562_cov_126.613793_g2431_i0~~NODE_2481_length_562_cov_126.613793_g2431_i0.p1  ORF type:complete len:160 (+),score=63.29 NODE_2481_length_562_cov_126.613793_g2431_i0:72-482(+)